MRVAVTGSSGLIGAALVKELERRGHEVTRVVRSRGALSARPGGPAAGGTTAAKPDASSGAGTGTGRAVVWDPVEGRIDAAGLEDHDAVVHLAAENVAGFWTSGKKRRIRESRIRGTRLLAETIAALDRPPSVFLSASAVGYYGDHPPAERVDEAQGPGTGFLAGVATEWEAASAAAAAAGIRTVQLRFGVVLSADGGMLAALLPLFRLGLGGRLGRGEQMLSWIAHADAIGAILHLLTASDLAGPVNVVAPQPVSNAVFTRALGQALRRPTPFAVPAFILRALAGEMAEEMLLGGVGAVPKRLGADGFEFRLPTLDAALRAELRCARD